MAGGQSTQKRTDLSGPAQDWIAQRTASLLRVAQQLGLGGASQEQAPTTPAIAATNNRRFFPLGPKPPSQQQATAKSQGAHLASNLSFDTLRDEAAKGAAAGAGLRLGQYAGLARGAVHGLQGAIDGVGFLARFADPIPLEPFKRDKAEVDAQIVNGAKTAINYVRQAASNPQMLKRDAEGLWKQWNIDQNPNATPIADTVGGELRRNFDIGQNQGEAAFNIGTAVYGGGPRGLSALGQIGKTRGVARYLAQGFDEIQAAELAKPYIRPGHHNVPVRATWPKFLGGGHILGPLRDSTLNLSKPHWMDVGEFLEHHYKVDPHFHGAGIGPKNAVKWSGKKLDLKKYGPLGSAYFGAPGDLKMLTGGIGLGGLLYNASDEDPPQ